MSRIPMLMQAGLLACCAAVTPVMAQSVGPDQSAPPPGFSEQPQAGAGGGAGRFIERFRAANTTGDGHLTLAQAEAARMPMIVRNFAAIDAQHKGFVTLEDLRAWRQQMRAERASGNGSRD
jgi:hypothetical protein